jgi:hypothetical protein
MRQRNDARALCESAIRSLAQLGHRGAAEQLSALASWTKKKDDEDEDDEP